MGWFRNINHYIIDSKILKSLENPIDFIRYKMLIHENYSQLAKHKQVENCEHFNQYNNNVKSCLALIRDEKERNLLHEHFVARYRSLGLPTPPQTIVPLNNQVKRKQPEGEENQKKTPAEKRIKLNDGQPLAIVKENPLKRLLLEKQKRNNSCCALS